MGAGTDTRWESERHIQRHVQRCIDMHTLRDKEKVSFVSLSHFYVRQEQNIAICYLFSEVEPEATPLSADVMTSFQSLSAPQQLSAYVAAIAAIISFASFPKGACCSRACVLHSLTCPISIRFSACHCVRRKDLPLTCRNPARPHNHAWRHARAQPASSFSCK